MKMTPRQNDLIVSHFSLACSSTNTNNPVFVILDLEDSAGFEIANNFQSDCAELRDKIRESGSYPAFTLALSVTDANNFISRGWPTIKRIEEVPDEMVFVILVSEERCLAIMLGRDQCESKPSEMLKPDLGKKLATSRSYSDKSITFFDVQVTEIIIIQRGQHTILFEYPHEDEDYAVSLDFGMEILNVILGALNPSELQTVLSRSVKALPHLMSLPRPINLTYVECRLGKVQQSAFEAFVPFEVLNTEAK